MNTDEHVETMRQVLGDALAKQMGIGYYYVTAETARAALAVVPMTEWQPIETAPKDGTAFIGLCDGLVYRVKWAQYYVKWPHEEGGPTFRGGWSAETSDQMFGCNPILWVPIPPERAGK